MGVFAVVVLVGVVLWWLHRSRGQSQDARQARETAGRAFNGAHTVLTDLFGSVGGQATPDFGPVPPPATFEPEGKHVLNMGASGDVEDRDVPDEDDDSVLVEPPAE